MSFIYKSSILFAKRNTWTLMLCFSLRIFATCKAFSSRDAFQKKKVVFIKMLFNKCIKFAYAEKHESFSSFSSSKVQVYVMSEEWIREWKRKSERNLELHFCIYIWSIRRNQLIIAVLSGFLVFNFKTRLGTWNLVLNSCHNGLKPS